MKLTVPYGFLENRVRGIYEVRPFTRGAFNSLDAKYREIYLENQAVEIPANLYYFTPFDAFKRGIADALEVAGFKKPSRRDGLSKFYF